MRTTLIIDDDLIEKASKLTGVKEKTSLVRLGLEALIARESGRRLAKLGGTEKKLELPKASKNPGAAEMILVDTSIWVSHLREGDDRLVTLLDEGMVCCHPFVIGELACGNLKNRIEILSLFKPLYRY